MKKSKTQARCNRIHLFPKTTFQRSVADLGFFHNLSADQLENLCLGIRLVRMVADVCHYERRDGHNLVRLRFQGVPDRAAIASSLAERRVFPPPREFAAKARIGSLEAYQALYRHS
nr:hypothetical protein [Aeromonas sp.]